MSDAKQQEPGLWTFFQLAHIGPCIAQIAGFTDDGDMRLRHPLHVGWVDKSQKKTMIGPFTGLQAGWHEPEIVVTPTAILFWSTPSANLCKAAEACINPSALVTPTLDQVRNLGNGKPRA